MRILHTSDWHLGHRLYERERQEEQWSALAWLLEVIDSENIDVLLVAGDIFDVGNPPNYARQQYFDFLAGLRRTACRHVVIIGGNHDSPSMLNAPAAVFRAYGIHIIGAATPDPQDQVLVLKNDNNQAECVIAAVPFLRDRDLHYSQAGESNEARERRLQENIRQHYEKMAKLAEGYAALPILTTGHLYAHGATAGEKRSNIYVGNRSNIAAADFPELFDYVALGHIHRPQPVGDQERVRYSGSLIPLDFSETADEKLVYVLDFNVSGAGEGQQSNDQPSAVTSGTPPSTESSPYLLQSIPVPTFRRLKQLTGTLEEVKEKLDRFLSKRSLIGAEEANETKESLPPWIEVRVSSDRPILLLREQLEEVIGDRSAELLAVKLDRKSNTAKELDLPLPDLSELEIEDVFRRRCQGEEEDLPADYEELLDTFRELRNWHQEKESA